MFISKNTFLKGDTMKQILEQWNGKFIVNGEVDINLDRLELKDGEEFHVRLLPKNKEVDDDLLSTF